MNILENLTEDNKSIIKFIIDGYDETVESISKGINSAIAGPGVLFNQVIGDSNCIIDFGSFDGLLALKLTYSAKDLPSTDTFESIRASELLCSRAKLNVFEQLVFLKSLYEQNLIMFSEEAQLTLGKLSLSDAERQWQKENSLHCSIWYIQSPGLLSFVKKFSQSHILPTKALRNYMYNGYKTEEQKRFNISKRYSKIAIGLSFLIGVGSPLLMTKCSTTSIDSNQLETILNAIPKQVDEVKLNKEQMDSVITIINKIAQPYNNGKTTNEKR